jgi:5-methylthioribose kinase
MVSKNLKMILQFKENIVEAIDKVEQGYKDAYPVYIELKDLVKFLTACLSQIEEQVIEEIGDERLTYAGYEIQRRNGSPRYSFNHIDNIKQLQSQIKDLEKIHKLAYDRQKKGLEPIVDANTGELVEPAIVKYTKDSIVLKKAK